MSWFGFNVISETLEDGSKMVNAVQTYADVRPAQDDLDTDRHQSHLVTYSGAYTQKQRPRMDMMLGRRVFLEAWKKINGISCSHSCRDTVWQLHYER